MGQVVSKFAAKRAKDGGEGSVRPKMATGEPRCECLPGNWYVIFSFFFIFTQTSRLLASAFLG